MATTSNTYTGNGSNKLFSITFPYLETTDVDVYLNGTLQTAYTFANATTIEFTAAPANGATVLLKRSTDDAALQATFFPGSSIKAADLNLDFDQVLYIAQETANTATAATATAASATTTANTALSQSSAAVSTANTASSNASAAVTTANTASTAASNATTTANTASSNATTAVNTANTASSNASTALSTANTALTNANSAVTTANTASSNATAAVSTATTALNTANTASSNATTAINTANTATTTANTANTAAASAVTTANNASTTANSAINAVSSVVAFPPVAAVANIPSSPTNGQGVQVNNSTGIESFSPLAGRPAGFVGDSGINVKLQYSTTGSTWNWIGYAPNDSDARYLKLAGGIVTGNLEIGNTGNLTFEGATADAFETTLAVVDPTADRTITLPNVTGTVVTTGDTGTVTSTMLLDGTIVNADVNASAAITGTKINPDFGSQNVLTTGRLGLGTNAPAAQAHVVGNTIVSNVDVANATYDGVSFSVAAEELTPQGLFFSPDGRKMFVIGATGDDINEYTLSTPWNVSTATYVTVFSVAAQDTAPNDLYFRNDGKKLYVVGGTNDAVFQYSLSTPWSIANAGYDGISFSVTGQETNPAGLFFKPDGLAFYICGTINDTIYRYNLVTAWDISTATFANSFSVTGQETAPHSLSFVDDGSRLFVLGDNGNDVTIYNVTTPWDITTSSYSTQFSVNSQDTSPFGLFVKPDGTKFYIVGNTTDTVYQYSIPSATINLTGTTNINGSAEIAQNLTVRGGVTISSNQLSVPLANAAAPSIIFDADINTGIYSPGENQVAISTDSTERLRIKSDGESYFQANNTTSVVTINQTGTGNALVVEDSNSPDASPFVIDQAGRVVQGTTASLSLNGTGGFPNQQLHAGASTLFSAACYSTVNWRAGSTPSGFYMGKARGDSVGVYGACVNNDPIGDIRWAASDGGQMQPAAQIRGEVDGTPVLGTSMPGRLMFSTTPSGAINHVERLRIASDGSLSTVIPGGTTLYPATMCRAWVNFDGTANTNLTGTYSQSGTTVTVTATAHGLRAGNRIYVDITTGTAVDGDYVVATVPTVNTFTYTSLTSLTTSGDLILVRNTIRGSFNVSSVADISTGFYTVNFATSLGDANYAVNITAADALTYGTVCAPDDLNQNRFRITTTINNGSATVDPATVCATVFR